MLEGFLFLNVLLNYTLYMHETLLRCRPVFMEMAATTPFKEENPRRCHVPSHETSVSITDEVSEEGA